MGKKKINQVTIRSSAAEYLTYVASVGGEESSVRNIEESVIKYSGNSAF